MEKHICVLFLLVAISTACVNGASTCRFITGDGIGGSEFKIGSQKGSACVDACLARKRTDHTINGVTVYSNGYTGGCWCEQKMDRRNYNAKYKSCFLEGITDPGLCRFITGDGIGGSEVKIGSQIGRACVDACLARKRTDHTINGVTMYRNVNKGGCWCEQKMDRINYSTKYKSCFLGGTEIIDASTCRFITGDGIGGSEVKVGSQKGRACIDACLARKRTDDRINGVTVYSNGNKGGCWCEQKMGRINNNAKYKSCFLGGTGITGASTCRFITGDGIGGSEVKIGSQKGNACVDACIARKRTDHTINGVTVYRNGNRGGCWCEQKMGRINNNAKYKSCFLGGTDGET